MASNFLDADLGSDDDDSVDFNPEQADVSDDEGQDGNRGNSVNGGDVANDSDDERPPARPKVASKAPRRERTPEDDDEGNDDEDEEDEDEEEEVQGHRNKRRRRNVRNQFLDVEAEVDESEDENDDDEDELNEIQGNFIADTHPDDLDDMPAGGDADDRRHRELDRRREMEASMDAEKQAEILRQRYAKTRRSNRDGDTAVIPKRLMLPSVEDPSIWAVKCKEGKEREVIFSITKRIEERMGTKDELAITSAFERASATAPIKGYIYVEAQRQAEIEQALDGLMNVYPRTKMLLVEIKEMPDLLRVKKTDPLEPGAYVRLKRPAKYAGDLAQVLDVTENGLEVKIRYVPRLDYGAHEDMSSSGLDAQGKRKRAANAPRPPPRLFSEVEAKKRHARWLTGNPQTKTWQYMGDEYINGYCEKDVKIQFIQSKDVNPTLEEVTRFAVGDNADGSEHMDLQALASSLKQSTANASYLPGDVIEVYEGEQKGVFGKAVAVQSDIVTMDVTEGPLRGQTIEVPIKGLRKRFKIGDHVKVIGGSRYRDEVGMVVKIVQDRVTILADQGQKEVTVFSKDLRESSDSGGVGTLGQFELWDLVQLDPVTVACITKVDRESLVVLDQNEQTRTVLPSQIANKIGRRRFGVATDRDGSEIRIDDVVKEIGEGGRQGKITHIHRSYLFLHSAEQTENAGIFVSRTTNVTTIAAKGGRINNGPVDLSTMNPAMKLNPNSAGEAMPPPKFTGRDNFIGKTVTVKKGSYKGLLGIVKEATDTMARVELHTKGKTINVPKESLAVKDPRTGATIDPNARGGYRGAGATPRGGYGSSYGGATPGGRTGGTWAGNNGRTPGGERTPAWGRGDGGRTPAWQTSANNSALGSRTPAWGAANDGSRTSYGAGADGSRTSYGGATSYGGRDGGRTPAWSAGGSKTPAYGALGDSGSKTPYGGSGGGGGGGAWDAGGRTPYGGSGDAFDAPTPGAPTPGAYGASAPTPGAFAAPTPGADVWGGDAATPGNGLGAPTPGAYAAAATPGGWDGADDS